MARKRHQLVNPEPTVTRRTLTAVGLGIGVASVGATLADLYRRPSLALGGMVLGLGLTTLHLPWDQFGKEA